MIASLSYAQDFEGVVHYKKSYTAKSTSVSINNLETVFGTQSVVYIKNGFYKTIDDVDVMGMQLFRYTENRLYFFNKGKDTLFYRSTLDNRLKEKFTYTLKKKTDTILGIVCDQLEIKVSPNITFVYYFSSKYSLDPSFYKNFTFINKNEILNRMKAVYLRFRVITSEYIYTSEAVDIEKRKLSQSIFDIPKYKILIEKP